MRAHVSSRWVKHPLEPRHQMWGSPILPGGILQRGVWYAAPNGIWEIIPNRLIDHTVADWEMLAAETLPRRGDYPPLYRVVYVYPVEDSPKRWVDVEIAFGVKKVLPLAKFHRPIGTMLAKWGFKPGESAIYSIERIRETNTFVASLKVLTDKILPPTLVPPDGELW